MHLEKDIFNRSFRTWPVFFTIRIITQCICLYK